LQYKLIGYQYKKPLSFTNMVKLTTKSRLFS